ncbi:MAG TPA: serine/threonine-protein kinase, partial [Thermoanaerobaculia bacterium]|nr:serine/threonine-protein kinase [Thermoanaerobaculia bacterium]
MRGVIIPTLTLSAGTRLGPYEIVAAIGAGGMGEVYRARDPRIGREVAIKVLPAALAQDPERLHRFEQEARATGTLSHPNLLTVFDVGNEERRPFLVSELLEGMTLRDVLGGGRLAPRKVVDYGTQIANGMAAAHAKGIVHRDLKPENIFVTTDGRVKLLDFGLAKFIETDAGDSATEVKTSPGVVLGTTAYMSPEQVRGGAIDHRSDIFSFGVVLYEMLAGTHPFRRETAVETMNAILRDDAPPIADAAVPPGLARLIEHAIEKAPSSRFESMKDLAFALGALTITGESSPSRPQRPRKTTAEAKPKEPAYERITFRRGFIMSARFAPDGTIVYGAAWEDNPVEVFAAHPSTPESQSLLADADVLSVSPSGELALALGRRYFAGWLTTGTLARRPIGGGAPRAICENVQEAEWTRDGKSLVILRQVGGLYRIESPVDNVLYQSALWISRVRLSPRGDLIAFMEHPVWGDDGGRMVVIDAQGQEKVRSQSFWSSTGGVAWTPKGDEVVVSAESGKRLVAINLNGRERSLLSVPDRMTLHDISKDGSVLVSFENGRREAMAGRIGQPQDRNLSWFDWTWIS